MSRVFSVDRISTIILVMPGRPGFALQFARETLDQLGAIESKHHSLINAVKERNRLFVGGKEIQL